MKKRIVVFAFAVATFLSLSSCAFAVFNAYEQNETRQGISDLIPIDKVLYIDLENSYFSDAQRAEGEVIYICEVAVCNDTDEEKSINFVGDFEAEYDAGIITEIYLGGETELQDPMFFVPANSTEHYTVCFRGEICEGYEGDILKMDRSLPAIQIKIANMDEYT